MAITLEEEAALESPTSGAARVGPETARTEEELCTAEAANGAEYIFG